MDIKELVQISTAAAHRRNFLKDLTDAFAGFSKPIIAAVVGIDSTDIGDVYTDPDNPVELEPIEIDPPTLSVVFEPSTSPLVGREGDIVGGR